MKQDNQTAYIMILIGIAGLLLSCCTPPCDFQQIRTVAAVSCDDHTDDGTPIWTVNETNTSVPMTEWECQSMRARIIAGMDTMGIWTINGQVISPADLVTCNCQ